MEEKFYFMGSFDETRHAIQIAQDLDIEVKEAENYRYYVCDEKSYKSVISKIVEGRLPGYWHYPEYWKK